MVAMDSTVVGARAVHTHTKHGKPAGLDRLSVLEGARISLQFSADGERFVR